MAPRRHRPLRTCVGCGDVKPKAALIRLVRETSGVVRVDTSGTAAGRGAYICSNASCIERVARRGRLGHAFRNPTQMGIDFEVVVRAAGRSTAEARGA